METYSGRSGCCISEEERQQMSWADQVDLVYPLEECWSESCLTDPHFCMEDHQIPEVRSGEEKVVCQDQAEDYRDTCDLREVDTAVLECSSDDESLVSLDQTQVYGDPFALPLMDWDTAAFVDPIALREVKAAAWFRKTENTSNLDQAYRDPFALREVRTPCVDPSVLREVDTAELECSDEESLVSLDQSQVYWDPFALPLMDWDTTACVDPFALNLSPCSPKGHCTAQSRKAKNRVNLVQTCRDPFALMEWDTTACMDPFALNLGPCSPKGHCTAQSRKAKNGVNLVQTYRDPFALMEWDTTACVDPFALRTVNCQGTARLRV